MFPETLQRAVSPAGTLSRQRTHSFGRFCPRNGVRHIHNALPAPVQTESQIRIFGKRFQTESARFVDRILAYGADCARHYGDTLPAVVSAPIQIKSAGVFQRLTTRDEGAQIANLRMT